ncbi:UDP-N-acetylglucosamine 2-epimerase (non-hydrolyzing) [candidate division KSB1 bacterium]|nr:UDP-N-acetylglucosamine 2-epimerase (non-hydrolyzing) [candidate division KSB1 bacterium]RQW09261.1 MAG: UDP-N-acetylglucosamine 2-epimerase (non-hydrolyzing) [candidate division KSB1 bacterium]
MKVVNVVGARPNFMKIAPIHRRMQASSSFAPILLHTGQHYDEKMSSTFFVELGLPQPDVYLGVGSGTHAEQTAAILIKVEKFLLQEPADLLIVVGDVNSTIAASLAAAKLRIPIAHVEAGLRSFDRSMPEEINRILTDSISDYLFVTEQSGLDNLKKEGIPDDKVFLVGNCMIDSLVEHLQKAAELDMLRQFSLFARGYALMTLHRPSNVDSRENMRKILRALEKIQSDMPIVFPIHPRTRKMLTVLGLDDDMAKMSNIHLTEPLGYLPFLNLMSQAKLIVTDSGGIQEETTFLKIPCLTLRENTERPITSELGTNQLVGMEPEDILAGYEKAMNGFAENAQIPPLWDGLASKRIVDILQQVN